MSAARPAVRSLLSRQGISAAPGRAAGSPQMTMPTRPMTTRQTIPAACHQHQRQQQQQRQLHCSAPLAARRRPRFKSVQAHEMGLTTPAAVDKFATEHFPEYSAEELEQLKKYYSDQQLEALRAAEQAVDPRDLVVQGRLRDDPYHLGYVDDMATREPVIDKRLRTKPAPDMKARFMTPDEFTEDLLKWVQSFVPKDVDVAGLTKEELEEVADKYGPSDIDIVKYMTERSSMTDGGRGSNSALAPALMDKVPGVAGLYERAVQDTEDDAPDDEGKYQDLKKLLNLKVKEIISLPHKKLVVRRVVNQTRLGKIEAFHTMAAVGNMNGIIGLGEGKSANVAVANHKARLQAIKNMMPIRRYENRTIYGNVKTKIGGTIVEMSARPPGFGLRVSHRIFEICRLAGIRDVSGRITRSRNPMNTIKAVFKCLTNQPDPEAIAIGRGKKMVDVRKVYYGGAVH